MGVLDVFHGFAQPGQVFVWLRSLAALTGGLCFALVWLPERVGRQRWVRAAPWAVAVGAAALGCVSQALPQSLPLMVVGTEFTSAAKFINILSGTLFAAALVRFVSWYWARPDGDHLLFAGLCLLFAASGCSFPVSAVWRADWWLWHLLRLAACFIAASYMLRGLTIGRKVGCGLALALLLVAVVAVSSFRTITSLTRDADRVAHTHRVLEQLEAIVSGTTAAETASRGYVITGDETFLKQFDAAVVAVHEHLKSARHLSSDNPARQRRLDQLGDTIDRKIALGRERVEARRTQGLEVAARLGGGEGRRVMDDSDGGRGWSRGARVAAAARHGGQGQRPQHDPRHGGAERADVGAAGVCGLYHHSPPAPAAGAEESLAGTAAYVRSLIEASQDPW